MSFLDTYLYYQESTHLIFTNQTTNIVEKDLIFYISKKLFRNCYGLNYIAYSFVDQKGILSIRLDRGVIYKKEPKV